MSNPTGPKAGKSLNSSRPEFALKKSAGTLFKAEKWAVHSYERADDHFNDEGTWNHEGDHSDEMSASKHARDLYQRGAYNVKVTGPDGKESNRWAKSDMADKPAEKKSYGEGVKASFKHGTLEISSATKAKATKARAIAKKIKK